MDTLTVLNRLIVSIGLPSIVAVLLYIGRKLQTLDTLEKTVEKELKPDLKNVRERFSALEGKLSGYTKSFSPIALTPEGEALLTGSGLKEYINQHQDAMLRFCNENLDMDTAYDIQESVFYYFEHELTFHPAYDIHLKDYAYSEGISIEALRRLGAIYFRDICLTRLGKNINEVEATTTKYNKLVRDNIPEYIRSKGGIPIIHRAKEEEYWLKLKEKLREEVEEFNETEDMEEIADILEVLGAIADYRNFNKEEINQIKEKKAINRGKFEKRIILDES